MPASPPQHVADLDPILDEAQLPQGLLLLLVPAEDSLGRLEIERRHDELVALDEGVLAEKGG